MNSPADDLPWGALWTSWGPSLQFRAAQTRQKGGGVGGEEHGALITLSLISQLCLAYRDV